MKTSEKNNNVRNLKPFIREKLDVLFIALNPPKQSNSNGHYFSGKTSRFFYLLHNSGLITQAVDKSIADDEIFGNNTLNFKNSNFGVIDIVPNIVETKSSKVKVTIEHIDSLVEIIKKYKPKIVCIIHSKVLKAINRSKETVNKLTFESNSKLLKDCETLFFFNYFPNGNNKPDSIKLKKFREIKELL